VRHFIKVYPNSQKVKELLQGALGEVTCEKWGHFVWHVMEVEGY